MNKVILVLLLVFSFGCNTEENQKRKESEIKQVEIENKISKLVKENHIVFKWDTLDYPYTIQYKNIVLKSEKQLIERAKIIDIFEKDSITIVRLSCNNYPMFIMDLIVRDKKYLDGIIQNTSKYQELENVIIIVSIKKIQKMTLDIYPIDDYYDADEYGNQQYTKLDLQGSDSFLCEGELLFYEKIDF